MPPSPTIAALSGTVAIAFDVQLTGDQCTDFFAIACGVHCKDNAVDQLLAPLPVWISIEECFEGEGLGERLNHVIEII